MRWCMHQGLEKNLSSEEWNYIIIIIIIIAVMIMNVINNFSFLVKRKHQVVWERNLFFISLAVVVWIHEA